MWQHWNIVNIHDVANASVASITFCSAKDWNRLAVTWCSLDGGETCFGSKLFWVIVVSLIYLKRC